MLILFKPWRKPKDLKNKNESWSDAFSKHSFNDDVMNIINNMNVENECKDARNTYNRKLRNGEFNDPLLQGFVVNTSPADMSSLGTAILNDCRFDRNNNQDDDHYNNIANERSTLEPNGPVEQLVALATQTGLFKTQGEVDTGYVVPGSASFVTDNEKEILKMQRALMEEMRRDKRPAPSQLLNETPRSNRHKNNESDPSTDLSELESSAEFVDVCNRADAPFSPEDALQSIIEEFNMKDNEEQLRAVRIVGEHFISGTEEQLLCHISGAGGTGKTHVIHAIVEFFKRCGASEKLMLSASTGCAAVLISGYTLHALTFLGPHKTKSKQDQLERIWKNIKYLIVDEISMISAHFLHQVSERISKAKAWDPSVIDKPFGGVHIIFTGDIGQLPPVNAASLFSHTLVSKLSANISQTTRGQEALNGAFLWRQLNKVIELKKNVRAQSDEMFTNLLLRIREGRAWNGLKPPSHWQTESTKNYKISDYEVLLSRRLQLLLKKDPDTLRKFKDAPIVVGEKVLRDALNSKLVDSFATKTGQQVYCYHADDRYRKTALESVLRKRMLRAQSNITDDSIGMLPLVPGMKVMVTDNVAMRGGVANGCQGTLRDVKYEMNEYGERRAICAYVHVPGTNVQAPGLPPDVVPILPERNSFKYKDVNGTEYMISRSQLPLLPAYAFTANKIQGQSLKYAIVDLRSAHGTQALYVMISRAVCLDNLAVLRWFPSTKLDRRLSEAYRNEFDRLRTLDRRTIDEYHKRKWRPVKHRAPKSHF